MIDFRYHLVSIIAVFMALAVGIVLGSGPLRDPIESTLQTGVQQLSEQRDQARADLLRAEERIDWYDDAADELSAAVLPGRLDGLRVAVVTGPGADADLVERLQEAVVQAGAEVSWTVGVTGDWTDPERAEELEAAARAAAPAGLDLPEDAAPAQVAASVLARALVQEPPAGTGDGATTTPGAGAADDATTDGGTEGATSGGSEGGPEGAAPASGAGAAAPAPPPAPGTPEASPAPGPTPAEPGETEPAGGPGAVDEGVGAGILAALEDLGFVSVDGDPAAPASLALVVAAPAAVDEAAGAEDGGPGALVDLVVALDDLGAGAVAAGPLEAAQSGLLQVLRGEDDAGGVSTVDSADTTLGALAVVLALRAELGGESADYGHGPAADAAFPDVPGAEAA